jgi:F-type H+-transporting ATPase subunit gamma
VVSPCSLTNSLNESSLSFGPVVAGFKAYEQEEDSTGDIAEFSLANALYLALVEGHAAEQSARRTAMDNASGNAADMIGKLNLQYNRARQVSFPWGFLLLDWVADHPRL